MKKVLVVCGLALGVLGIYSGAFGENNSYFDYNYPTKMSSESNDTIPGQKRDTTNRKPLPKDTARKDSGHVLLQPMYSR